MVLEVGSDTGEITDNLDAKLVQLVGGTDTAQLEELRGVVDTTGNDHLAGSSGRTGDTSGGVL